MEQVIPGLLRKTLVFGALFMMCAAGAYAQIIWETGYEYGSYDKKMIPCNEAADCSCPLTHEEDYSNTFRMGLGFQIPDVFGNDADLEVHGGFAYSTSGMRASLDNAGFLILDSGNDVYQVKSRTTYDYHIWSRGLWLNLLGRFPLSTPLNLELGLRSSYRIGARFEKHYHLVVDRVTGEGNTRLPEMDRNRVEAEGTSLDSSPFSAGAIVGLAYDIPLTTAITLRPGVRVHMDAGTYSDGSLWHTYAVGGNIGVLFQIAD